MSFWVGQPNRVWTDDIQKDFQAIKTANDLFVQADHQDLDDCAKMFICELNTRDESKLGNIESVLKNTFGANANGNLDVTKITAKFDFAAITGKLAGVNQCKIFYSRCHVPYQDMRDILETQLSGAQHNYL